MARYRVDYLGKTMKHLGVVDAEHDDEAIDKAANLFHIPAARRSKIAIEKIETRDKGRKN